MSFFENVFLALHLFSGCLCKCDNFDERNVLFSVLYFWSEMRPQELQPFTFQRHYPNSRFVLSGLL